MTEFVKKKCRKCGEVKKFAVGSEREKLEICGDCWDWLAVAS